MLESNIYMFPKNLPCEWLHVSELFSKELVARNSLGSSEDLDTWLEKLEAVYLQDGSFGIVIEDIEQETVYACAIVMEGYSLHQDNIASVFGMVAEEGYGFKLLLEVMRVAKSLGYDYLHYSKKIDLTTYQTKVIKL